MAINITVRAKLNESTDKLIKRFLKKVKKAEIIKEYLEKTGYYLTRSQKKRIKRQKNIFLRKSEENK